MQVKSGLGLYLMHAESYAFVIWQLVDRKHIGVESGARLHLEEFLHQEQAKPSVGVL